MAAPRAVSLRPRLRVLKSDEIALGPGKADLLDAIRRKRQLRAAAADLGMSYMRAWRLVQTMNRSFREPLVEYSRGGRPQGGARLTSFGAAILRLYREMERASLRASQPAWNRLRKLL